MKIEKGGIINDFIEPNRKQYSIPVYQRNYEWSKEQCKKLFDDIVTAHRKDSYHFCGSIVYAPIGTDNKIERFIIIDGQQRLTTIYILIKALIDCAETATEKDSLSTSVFNVDKFNKYDIDDSSKLKLKPIKSDNQQLMALMSNKFDVIDKSSGIYRNYILFCEMIKAFLENNPDMGVQNIYDGLEHLTCADIKLETEDNAQEIFERINSTGVPLSLADKIRNFVLMTDKDQERLYEDYWLKSEQLLPNGKLEEFFIDYLNLKLEGFAKASEAYDAFKELYNNNSYTNETMLQEILHYASFYHIFLYGSNEFSNGINDALKSLRELKQTTIYIFLFRVMDDYLDKKIDESELEKILKLFVSYSVRRIICEINSNSLRGLYKTLYNRAFIRPENKDNYYDAIVSFMNQLTSRDVIPSNNEFRNALHNNDLYHKSALCKYLLVAIENQGKEKLQTENLTVEHVLPQNKNISTAWQTMLGENWENDKNRWLHTLGNLTLTGYNSELGDKPFDEKKQLIEAKQTKVVILYSDIQSSDVWNADIIEQRAKRLEREVLALFPIEPAKAEISFDDPRYKMYTCEDPHDAKFKYPSYYVLLGERVNIDNFADMMRSVASKLYELDSSIIENMAKNNESLTGWKNVAFSYDETIVKGTRKIKDTDIYITSGYSAPDIIDFISKLLKIYDLDISEDFVYCARTYSSDNEED